jgi:hypothetical protein
MLNLRDLGGLPLLDGARTRHGVLFRSGESIYQHCHLWPQGGFDRVIDLRRDSEVRMSFPVLEAPYRRHMPLAVGQGANWPTAHDRGANAIADVYLEMLQTEPHNILPIIRAACRGGKPVLIHCIHGRDRTGIVVATLLSMAGVNRDSIVNDYAQCETARAPAEAMDRFLQIIDDRFGGIPELMRSRGATDDDFVAARAQIIDGN